MPFRVGNHEYYSTLEAAEKLGLNPRTLRSLMRRGTLPEVDKYRYVTRSQRGFTEEWINEARQILEQP